MDVCRIGNPFEAAFVEARDVGDVCVAVIDERVLSDHQSDAAKYRLAHLATLHAGKLAISMANTGGSSMGLFAGLLQVRDYCAKCGGRMVIFNLPDETTEALIGFGLLDNFTRADNLEQAIEMVHQPVVASGRGSWLSQLLGIGRAAA